MDPVKNVTKSPEAEIVCLYHANCTDGAASAAVVRHKYPQAKCLPVNHGDALHRNFDGKIVYIVDFSFPTEILKRIREEAKTVHWYDHHKTAIPIQKELGWGVLDLKESGASLTWKQEFEDQAMPRILHYVRDKDLYEWKLKHSREVSMYLRGLPEITNPLSRTWKHLLRLEDDDPEWKQMIEVGALALKFQRRTLENGLKGAFELDFHGHRALAVNWNLEASDMGECIYKELGYDIAIVYYYTGKEWNFSLRSHRVDVSKIALEYGGGGHPGASGFRQEKIDFLIEKKTKVPKLRL